MLKESIQSFKAPIYTRVKRGGASYHQTIHFIVANLNRLVKVYKQTEGYGIGDNLQTLRLIRDEIDHNLRRYHGYTIKGSIGSHYKQVGIKKGIFEHMVPASTIRDLLLAEKITAHQACNMPTCLISKENDDQLRSQGFASTTPDIYNFWKRYSNLNGQFVTYKNEPVLMSNWNLDNHFDYFG